MAVNVTEKDKTLNEIIDWCEQLAAEGLRLASALLMQHDMDAYGVVRGQINAYEKTADHCRSMLGYSGSMPSEVPNQSEDTILAILTSENRTRNPSKAKESTMFDELVDQAIEDGTTYPDGLHLFRVKFNDAGEMYGLTQVTTD